MWKGAGLTVHCSGLYAHEDTRREQQKKKKKQKKAGKGAQEEDDFKFSTTPTVRAAVVQAGLEAR